MSSLIQIFSSPKELFRSQKEDASWVLPAILTLLFMVLSFIVVQFSVDTDAVFEAQIQAMAEQGVPQANIDALRDQYEAATSSPAALGLQIGVGIVVVVLLYFVVLVLHSVYYLIVGKIVKAEVDFGDWFAFCAWARMPLIVLAIVTILVAILNSGSADPLAYLVLSFAYWVDLPNETPGMVPITSQVVWSLDLILIWCIALLAIGYKEWTDRSMGEAVTIAAIPYVIIYAIVFLI